ncbi:MAG: acetyl-CoA carboxylase biotin carboxylase subunit [Hyphomicrobiales bacterium]
MFGKILIANRGEIACRIIKTARRMGIRTVAVYSAADAQALHVELADEAIDIGPPPASQSYLNVDKIVQACRTSGAEAAHPGYGFLSERSDFARGLAAQGIVFIGPNPEALDAMGDKIHSKETASAAGLSIVPGHLGIVGSDEEAAEIAERIGYPVMIKASAGGGGKGMRVAHTPAELQEGFARARSEAKSSFGDDRVFLEKFIADPRHIEVQVLGDKHGNIIHLGERECSIQRRNQKIIEEAPSPLLNPETREAMYSQAVALARAVHYDSAGTVEFVAGQDRSFYFLEMNTRLQVEHPVTELVTGIDLVEQMIRVAAGERLSIRQKDVKIQGWAIESRIYAEDPYRDFAPSTGRLVEYHPPIEPRDDGIEIRNDTGVSEGSDISIHYDPMIAKLCTHAADRQAATSAMADALDRFVIEGIEHNIPLLSAVMTSARWRSGALSTSFLAAEYPQGFRGSKPDRQTLLRLGAVAVTADHIDYCRRRQISGRMSGKERPPERVVKLGHDWIEGKVMGEGGSGIAISLGDLRDMRMVTAWTPGKPVFEGTIDREQIICQLRRILDGYRLFANGVTLDARVYNRRQAELARLMPDNTEASGSNRVLCPMPGLVVSVMVTSGQKIKAGEPLAIVEAMKMENVLRAERDGTVKTVHVRKGDSIAAHSVILELA